MSARASRRLILGRALVAGAAGLVPLPYLDDVLAQGARAALIRRLAERRGVDVDEDAIAALTQPRGSPLLRAAGVGAVAMRASRRTIRRVAISLLILRRVDDAVSTFQIGSLFDHYCARHHVGAGLEAPDAELLRATMDEAIRRARSRSFAALVRRTLQTLARAPRPVGRWARSIFRKGPGPIEAERITPGDLEPPAAVEERLRAVERTSLFRRAVGALETSLERGYVDALEEAFDHAHAERKLK